MPTATMPQEVTPTVEAMPLSAVEQLAETTLAEARQLFDDPVLRAQFRDLGVKSTSFIDGNTYAGHQLRFASEEGQLSRSYKSRGATVAVMRALARGFTSVHTVSSGNHGASVAYAAQRGGLGCTVHLPAAAPEVKKQHSRNAGATIVEHDDFTEAEHAAQAQQDSLYLHPFGHEARVGQTTLGLELVDYLVANGLSHDHVTIPVSIGGGGHIYGIAVAVWDAKRRGVLGPDVLVVGVQAERNDTVHRAIKKMRRGQPPVNLYKPGEQRKHVDALAIGEESLDPDNLALIDDRNFVSDLVTVSEESVGTAMRYLRNLSLHAEPAVVNVAYALEQARYLPYIANAVHDDPQPRVTFLMPLSGFNVSEAAINHFEKAARPQVVRKVGPSAGALLLEKANTKRRGKR